MTETFTIEVLKGKKKVIGKLNINAGEGIWPNGEWVPTEPIEDDYDLQAPGKKAKFDGAPGIVTLNFSYGGSSTNAVVLLHTYSL